MKLFVPYYAWKQQKLFSVELNPHVEIIPFHTVEYNGLNCFRHFFYKKGLSMPKAQNVLVPSIFNAINMGYKEICLYGVDHSWTRTLCVNNQNLVCAIDSHFYDTTEKKMEPYLKRPGESFMLHELLRAFANMFESYQILRNYADYMGCRIINYTKDSFIDAFERI